MRNIWKIIWKIIRIIIRELRRRVNIYTTGYNDEMIKLNHITLSSTLGKDEKLKILSQVYNKIEEMIMHFDNLRQRNLNFALVVFAGLFGLSVKIGTNTNQFLIPAVITAIMFIFLRIDRKYHIYSHGFQWTSYFLIHKMGEVDNGRDIKFDKYNYKFSKTAELLSLQSVIYYCLIIGGILAYFLIPYTKHDGK